VFYSLLIYDCITFTSHDSENVLNENTVRTEGIQNHSTFDIELYISCKTSIVVFY